MGVLLFTSLQRYDMRAFSEALYSICIFILTKQEVVAAVRDASRAWVWCPDNSHSQPIVQPLLYICKTRLTRISRRLEIPVPVILQKKTKMVGVVWL